MFELGAVHFKLHNRPIILLRRDDHPDQTPTLPADIRGTIDLNYDNTEGETLADYLEEKLLRTKMLVDNPNIEHYMSPKQLRTLSRFSHLPETFFQDLAERYPTQEAWKLVNEKELESLLEENADLAGIFLKRIREKV